MDKMNKETLPKMSSQYESLGMLFYNQIKRRDYDKVCMIDGNSGEEITFGKFLKVSVNLAKELEKLGIKKGTVITIVSRNSWKYLVALIASFYIGAQINLLNPDYTTNELQVFLSTCQPSLLFCSQKPLDNILKIKDKSLHPKNIVIFNSNDSNYISFDQLLENNKYYLNFSPTKTDPDDVALILTSSGTTGFPKCVLLTYANIYSQIIIHNKPDFFDINENETVMGVLPFFHLFGGLIILSSILHGGKLVILEKFIPDIFLRAIENYKITKLFTVPSVLLFLAKNSLVENYDISSINDIVCGGAVCTKDLEQLIQEKFSQSIRQVFGMTETSGVVSMIPKNVTKMGSVGKTSSTQETKICDINSGDTLPPYNIGELRIRGSGIMKGYLGNEEATKAIFDENGFIKSGDLGYYDDNGFLYVVGRMKEIIKYKGFQVSPAELENLLIQHPAVKEVAVIGKPDVYAGELPTAFVVKAPNRSVTEEEIIRFVEENISIQKRLHGGVKFLEEIPKNSVGKILKNKLIELL